jgi:hypothetical protein
MRLSAVMDVTYVIDYWNTDLLIWVSLLFLFLNGQYYPTWNFVV